MIWQYADKYGELPSGQAEIVEALVAIAEQLEQLNEKLKTLKITGKINTQEMK